LWIQRRSLLLLLLIASAAVPECPPVRENIYVQASGIGNGSTRYDFTHVCCIIHISLCESKVLSDKTSSQVNENNKAGDEMLKGKKFFRGWKGKFLSEFQ